MNPAKKSYVYDFNRSRDCYDIGEAIANCAFRRISGECDPETCTFCETYYEMNRCYNKLSDVEKLRVQNDIRLSSRKSLGAAIIYRIIYGTKNKLDASNHKSINIWLKNLFLRIVKLILLVILGVWLISNIFF